MKCKMGMDIKKNKRESGALTKRFKKKRTTRKERIIPSPEKGCFLPFLLPLLGALGVVGRGAASIAKAVNDAKSQTKQQGSKKKGLYLKPYKDYGLYLKPYKKNSH